MLQVPGAEAKFSRKLITCITGGFVAAFAESVVFVYAGSMVLASVVTNTVASTVSTVTNNLQDDSQEVQYNPYQAQQTFRDAASNFLHAHLEPILRTIQRNRPGDFGPTRLVVGLGDNLRALQFANTDSTAVSFEYNFRVRPRPGTTERDISENIPPSELLNFTDL